MKYSVLGFNQQKLVDFGLDLKDTMLLRYFVDFKETGKMRNITLESETYYWLKYEAVVDEFPLLDIKTKDTVYRRLQKLVKSKILKHTTVKDYGNYSYYSLGEKYEELLQNAESNECNSNEVSEVVDNSVDKPVDNTLVSDEKSGGSDEIKEGSDEIKEGLGRNQGRVGRNQGTNNPSTIYPSTNNPSTNNPDKEIKEIVEYLNKKTNSKFRYTDKYTKTLIKDKLNNGFTLADLKIVIDKKVKQWDNTTWSNYLRPSTLFGNKFENYLNEKDRSMNFSKSQKGHFNNFTQRDYDCTKLERLLLGYDNGNLEDAYNSTYTDFNPSAFERDLGICV